MSENPQNSYSKQLSSIGILNSNIKFNFSSKQLSEVSVKNKQAKLTSTNAISINTGKFTGRSPEDRFIVEEASTRDQIEWGNVNQPFNSDDFNNLWNKVSDYLSNKKHYKTEVHVGSNKDHYIPVEVKCEKAWHSLFSKLIFIVPDEYNSENKEVWQLISAPDFVCDPDIFVLIVCVCPPPCVAEVYVTSTKG